jgi:subfamily B ATP-binding cassette protein MsbA
MQKFTKLVRFIYPYKGYAFLNIVLNLISILFSIGSLAMIVPFLGILFKTADSVTTLLPWSFSNFKHNMYFYITEMVDKGPERALLIVSFLVVIMTLLKTSFNYFASFYMAPIINGVVRDFQKKLYHKILILPLSYFSNERKGDIMARMTSDVNEIKFSIMSSLDMIFRDPLTIIVYLGFLVYTSPQLTLFAMVALPIGGAIIAVIGKKLRKQSMIGQIKMGELLSQVEETLSGLRIIKAFNAEKKMDKRFEKLNNSYYKVVNRLTQRRSLSTPLSEFLGTIIVIVIMYYGGIRVLLGDKTMLKPEEFIAYLAVFSQIITPAKSLSNAYYNIQKGLASISRINFILDAEISITDKENALEIKSFNHSIEFKNVTFAYREAEVLKNINLKVEKGKSIALVGQSGSGKSTLVDLIPRFYDIKQGDILIDGVAVKDYKIHDLRGIMGNVNQESILFNDSIFNNIAFGVESATLEQVIAAAKVANAHDFIMATENGYDFNIGDRGSKLSGGQRQRISIARAVLKNPPILILDEATSALDTESEYLVQEALTNLMKNRTSIVIAHRLSTIKNADEICVLHEGRIVEQGKHDDLLAVNGFYKKLYDLQVF